MKLTFYDAFSGMGGIRLGMEEAGFTCVGSCEIDHSARLTYAKNFGHKPKHTDIKEVIKLPGKTLVLCGGFPCQAFSLLGKRQGFSDPRGNLFFELARLLDISKPKVCFFENVKGLISHDKRKTFETILGTLKELGYYVSYKVLNSEHFGLPQKRERIFIVGFRDGKSYLSFKFPEGDYTRKTLSKIVQKNVGAEFEATKSTLTTYLKKLKERSKNKGGQFMPSLHTLDEVGNTLVTSGNKTLIFDKEVIRKLTPREWARMQGFPDSFELSDVKTQAYKQIGNSVPVPVITAIGKSIKKAIGE